MWILLVHHCLINIFAGLKNKDVDFKKLNLSSDTKKVQDLKGQYLLLFSNEWGVRWATDKNPDLVLAEFSQN